MTDMVDPTDSLISFQQAYDNNLIKLEKCKVDKDLNVLFDYANDKPRITYALIEDGYAKAISIFILTEPIDNIECFNMGYAVAECFRLQGYGKRIVKSSIEQIKQDLKLNLQQFYIEAVVGIYNTGSNKLAHHFISNSPVQSCCTYSGTPAKQYLRLIC